MINNLNVQNDQKIHLANSLASCFFVENPSGLAQNLGTVVKESESEYEYESDSETDNDVYMVL